MNKSILKRALSVIICISIVLSVLAFGANAETVAPEPQIDTATGSIVPIVEVCGFGASLKVNENSFDFEFDFSSLPDELLHSIPSYVKALFTGNWKDFGDKLYNIISPICEDILLDENGIPINDSTCTWTWKKENIRSNKVNGRYKYVYDFYYDWRMDPYENADLLNAYINDVCEQLGEEKVALVGFSEGSCVSFAYLQEYGHNKISDFIVHCGAVNGVGICNDTFSGNLNINWRNLEHLLHSLPTVVSEPGDKEYELINLGASVMSLLKNSVVLNMFSASFSAYYKKARLQVTPKLLRATFGTFPGMWAMVSDEYYEKAKATVFYGTGSKYEVLINKIDNYHYNVQKQTKDILQSMIDDGVDVGIIANYGFQDNDVFNKDQLVSDNTIFTKYASFGATTSVVNGTLSKSHVKDAEQNGNIKYISPDKQIDASTCFRPYNTWFIKDHVHGTSSAANRLWERIVNNDGFTIYSDANYPQYLVYDYESNTTSPMTTENCNKAIFSENIFTAIKNIFKSVSILKSM